MRGLSREETLGWRNRAIALLKGNFNTVHALRGREERETFNDGRLAIVRDKRDIDNADIVLVNDSFPSASMIGTSMEVLYAFEKGKVVIVFGNAHCPDYWLDNHIQARFDSIEAACETLNKLFVE